MSMKPVHRTLWLLAFAFTSFAAFTSIAPQAFGADDSVLKAEKDRIAVVDKVTPSVVAIFARGGAGGGSGVLISPDGYALTNFHVTNGAGNFMKCGLADGVLYDAVIVGIDPTGDVALIKLLGRDDFPYSKMGDSNTVRVGDWSFAMGNPFLLATDFRPTVTYGIVSGVQRYQYPAGTILEYTDCIQIDTSINPGNSGGPLFNVQGDVVGINGRGSFEKRGRVNSGAGYAISINQIKNFMDHLRSGRIVDHATLGAVVSTRDDGAVVVNQILEESEAFRRGLRVDDEIVSFGGRPIGSVNQFKNVLGIYPKGWKIPLVYRRENQKTEIYVRLRALHRESELLGGKKPAQPGRPQPGPPGPRKPGDPPGPRPAPTPMPAPTQSKPPEKYAKMFVQKKGFANAYFNDLERDRVLKGLAPLGNFAALGGTWKFSGKMGEASFDCTLAEKGVGLILDDGKTSYYQKIASDADYEDEPPASGGLLVALHHVRLMLTQGAKGFASTHYEGSEPFDGRGELVDVVIAELSGIKSFWYFRKGDGSLLGCDLQRADDVDPCELRFSGFRDFSGVKLPEKIHVAHAGRNFAELQIGSYQLSAKKAEPETKPEPKKTDDVKKPDEKKPATSGAN